MADALRDSEGHASQIIIEYKQSDDYLLDVLPYVDRDKEHILRVAATEGTPLRCLVRWAEASTYSDAARAGHELVPFGPEDLTAITEDDMDVGKGAWIPPHPFRRTLQVILDART